MQRRRLLLLLATLHLLLAEDTELVAIASWNGEGIPADADKSDLLFFRKGAHINVLQAGEPNVSQVSQPSRSPHAIRHTGS
ncbi:hypothetical protein AB1Y20_013834 [Prymnesium parvum]|uniref:Uncharacterized protein n=1 Tax=Prymnesium parvum TaxID=97485 RepID=A0AB34IGM0_PRYPA